MICVTPEMVVLFCKLICAQVPLYAWLPPVIAAWRLSDHQQVRTSSVGTAATRKAASAVPATRAASPSSQAAGLADSACAAGACSANAFSLDVILLRG